ncbi:beta-N-acetylhexosaminidase [Pedobacter nyackensis]|uniref:beta-N-acetylhexosaminidase n=1 Tax=Pedobacter nyackensis TaxID=475255 RepID=UPI00292E2EBF|nr:family 20 glycosylhydrolase [Pedobacter nyackensis]
MKLNKWLLLSLLFFNALPIFAQLDIVPLPRQIKETKNSFTISKSTPIYYEKGLKKQAELLSSALSPATGFDFVVAELKKPVQNAIVLRLDKNIAANKEGYRLSVNNTGVSINGGSPAGVFYGIQTVLQLLPPAIFDKERQKGTTWKVKGVEIEDAPLYPWRGMMLDVARYFFSKEYVLKYIDMMAMYKMNVLHMHLVDDSGWRLEIKKYPKLTSIGAWSGLGANRQGGYYTQEDIKEIIAYATVRNVDVIPEIELPAHTLSAVAAYPYLCCTGEQYIVQTQHSISGELYCVGQESTFDFLADVFAETFALFPSKYVHIGGDEARYDRWKACPHCQKRKKDLNLTTEKELRNYFTIRVQKMVGKYGKTIVGWDEMIEDGIKDKVVGMIWHDQKKTLKAVEAGHYAVMALTENSYLDVAESNIEGEIKAAGWLPPISLEKSYSLNPMMNGLDEKYRPQIVGAQGALWSDQFIHGTVLQELPQLNENRSEKYFDYLTFPRLAALAEACWTPLNKKDFKSFEKRLSTHYKRYDHAGYGYRVPLPNLISNENVGDGFTFKLENPVKGAEIRYTTDGTRPNVYSAVYTGPVKVNNLSDFYAITVVNRAQYSLPLFFPENYDRFKAYGQLVAEWKPEKIKSDYADFEISVSGKVNQNGAYQLAFLHVKGTSGLNIQSIEIFKNGKKIGEDIHEGFAGPTAKDNIYKFNISDYETGAAYLVKAKVRGKDSSGAVFITRD